MFSWVKNLKIYFFENLNSILFLAIFNFILFCIHRNYNIISSLRKLNDFLFIISVFSLIYLFIYIFNFMIKNILSKFILFSFSFLFLIEIFLFYNFQSIISLKFIQIFYETNTKETIEFLETYLTIPNILFIFFTIFILFFIYFNLNFILKKLINTNKISDKKFLFILSLLLFFLFHDLFKDSYEKNMAKFDYCRIYILMKENKKNIDIYKNLSNILEKTNASILKNNSIIENIVVILGESTAKNHMSLYNYQHKTTPLLDSLKEKGNLFIFNDVISSHSQTLPSVKKMFSFLSYENENRKEWYEYENLLNIIKKAGYKTFWYSNQEAFGKYGNITAALASLSTHSFFNDPFIENKDSFDNDLIPLFLNTFEQNKSKKNFIVFHLMGAHATYKERYPESFKHFNAKDYNFNIKSTYNKRIVEYDNAILYNDFVVTNIINLFKNKEAIIIYVPDHGEEILEFREFYGHADTNYSKYMLEIPFLIFVSDKLKDSNPNLIKNIKNSLNNPYMTDDFIHTILDIANISTTDFDETRSIINPNFNKNRKRILVDGKDYDYDLKNNL